MKDIKDKFVKRQYRSNQGKTPEKVEQNYKVAAMSFMALVVMTLLIVILNALGVHI